MYISERGELCSDDPGGRDNGWTTPAIENLDIKTHLENNINFDIITIKTMSETTTVAVEVKEVASTTGASDTKVRTEITSIDIRIVDGRSLYVINTKDSVPGIDEDRNYIWFSPAALRANLVDSDADFDIVLDNYVKPDKDKGIDEVLPMSTAQAKTYLTSAAITVDCHYIAAGEIVNYGGTDYEYSHDAIKYSIVSITLAPKAQARLDRKIDSLL